jgi:hypothetical protein
LYEDKKLRCKYIAVSCILLALTMFTHILIIHYFDKKYLRQNLPYIAKCPKCHGALLNDSIKYMNASYFTLGIVVCMFLGGSFAEFRRFENLPVHKKFLRLIVQCGWPILSACALYPFFKVKGMEEHFIDSLWQLIYGPLITGIIFVGWFLLPAMLWQQKAGIQDDWIRDVRHDKKVDDLLKLGGDFKDKGVALIDLNDDEGGSKDGDEGGDGDVEGSGVKLVGGDLGEGKEVEMTGE